MDDSDKTRRQLLEEIRVLRTRNAKLESVSHEISEKRDAKLKPHTSHSSQENEELHNIAKSGIDECKMKKKMMNRPRIANNLILIGVGLAVLSWILESDIHAVIFYNGKFFDQILPSNPNELWMRLEVCFILICFSIYAQLIVKKLGQAKVKLQQSHNEFDFRTRKHTTELTKTNEKLLAEITERKRREKLAGIQRDLAIKLSAATELEDGLSLCLEAAICASEMDCGGIYLVDEDSGAFELAVHRGLSDGFVKSIARYDADSENIKLVMKGEPAYAEHKQLDVLLDQTQKDEGLKAIAVVPVLNEDRIIGCLNIASHVFDHINAQSRLVLETIAAQIGSTVARLKVEEALRESEERYHSLYSTVNEGIALHELIYNKSGEPIDYRILDVNPAYEFIFGIKRKEAVGAKASDLYGIGEAPYLGIYSAVAVSEESFSFETYYEPIDKHFKISVFSPAKGKFATLFADITERKKAEEALRKSEEQLRLAVQAAQLSTWDWDLLTDEVHLGGHSTETLGLAPDVKSIPLSYFLDRVNPEDIDRVQKAVSKAINERTLYNEEYRIIRPDGTERWIAAQGQPFYDKTNKAVRMIGVNQDITERKKAQEQLQNIFNLSLDMMCIADINTNTFIKVNPAFESTLGFTEEELLGRPFIEFIHPEDVDKTLCVVRENLRRGLEVINFENRYRCKDGSYRWLNWVSHPVQEQGLTYAVAHDVTESKRAEEALKASKDFADNVIETANAIVVVISLDGNINTFNKFAEKLTGYKKEEVLGKNWFDLFIPENEKVSISEVYKKVLEDCPETSSYENCIVTKSGEKRLISWKNHCLQHNKGTCTGNISIGIDITEQKETQEALKESREKIQKQNEFLNNVLESLTHPFLVIDVNNYKVKIANSAARLATLSEETTCYALSHKLDRPCDESNHPCPIRDTKKFGHTIKMEHIHYDTNGKPRNVEIHSYPIIDDKGDVTDIIEYCLDITKRKQAEEKLMAYQAQLCSLASELLLAEERQRHLIATELHDNASQEIAFALTKLHNIRETAGGDSLESLNNVCEMLKKVLDNVRNMTFDICSPTLYKFGLETAVSELLEDKLGTRNELSYSFCDDNQTKPLPEDVKVAMFQSVRELVNNLIKHARANNVTVDIRRCKDNIRITVSDDGVGFKVEELESSEQSRNGFGLFSISERLKYIGGSFEFQSQPGHGSSFTLEAPLETDAK